MSNAHNPDADLFSQEGSSSGHKHVIDGSTCPRCNKVHRELPFDNLPEADMEMILSLLDTLPDEMVDAMIAQIAGLDGARVPPHADFLNMFFGLRGVGGYDRDNRQGPMLRAMAEVLDEITSGEVTKRYKVFEAERQLVVSHQLLKLLNNALAEAPETTELKGLSWALEFVCDFMVDRLAVLADNYRKVAANVGYPVDEQLIDCGVYKEPSDLAQITMLNMMNRPLDS